MSNEIGSPYREAAQLYWEAGWRGILPIPPRSKRLKLGKQVDRQTGQVIHPGWTGHDGIYPSFADVTAWMDGSEGDGNIALRLPDGVIGIDVDAYGTKKGAETLAAREAEWGPLPATWTSSARPWPSGIRFYRTPTGLSWPGEIGPGIEIVQRSHRYAVVWPSWNPDAHAQYMWHCACAKADESVQIPRPGDFPALPDEWVHGMANGLYAPDRKAAVTDTRVASAVREWDHPDGPCRLMRHAVADMVVEFRQGARHEVLNGPLLHVVRLAERGHRGLHRALHDVHGAFLRAATDPTRGRSRSDAEADHEWRRALGGAVAIVLAAPEGGAPCSCDIDLGGLIPPVTVDDGRPRVNTPGTGADAGEGRTGGAETAAAGPAAGLEAFLLPDAVWSFSGVTSHIYQAARARLVSPDVLLHAVLTIVASLLNYDSRVETGKSASVLSYYLAAIGMSGAGKSEALKVARELLTGWTLERFAITGGGGYVDGPLGSGEGLVEAFMDDVMMDVIDPATGEAVLDSNGNPKTRKQRVQARHNALFHTDEGRQVLAIDARKGSTVLAVMCEMWSGSVAGQTNADKDRTRKLAAGTYVVGMMLGFQTATIDALFADEAGGAPQRFVFAPAEYAPYGDNLDEDIDDEWPGQLRPEIPVGPVVVHLGAEQKALVRRAVRLKAAGKSNDGPLDGHRMLLTCRMAALLSLLHGKQEVSTDIWELAELLTERSCALRDWLAEQGERKAAKQRQARQDEAVATAAASAVVAHERTERVKHIEQASDRIVSALESEETKTLTIGRARNKVRYNLRYVSDEAISLAVARGLVEVSADGKTVRLTSGDEDE